MIHLGDITKIDGKRIEPVDVIVGGSPCQDLSVAGKRAGLAGERSGLFMEQIRLTKELRQQDAERGKPAHLCRPRYFVWENVPGAFSSKKGEDFAAVLEEVIRVIEPKAPPVSVPEKGWPTAGCLYDEMGRWSVAWRVHDAQFWGVPQRRRRIALVADFGGLSAPEVLFERKGLRWDPAPSGKTRQGAAADAERSSGSASRTYNRGGEGGNQKPMVYDARGNGDGETVCTITGDHENRVTDYNALCMQNTGQGWWNESQIGATLRTPSGGDATKANLVVTYQEVTGPIMANSHQGSYTGQDAYNDMLIAGIDAINGEEVYAIDHAITTGGNCTAQGPCVYKNIEATLKSSGVHAVSYESVDGTNCIKKHVRRLTPLECERLQGYPDGWTDIGEWIDSKGKRHDSSDSARYKALGNSIALPFWHWLMRRISAQYVGTPTLGSLFDGISGFCLSWARCNGAKNCRWSSEIEEFPMAVTRKHFGDEKTGEVGDIEKYL